MLRLVSSYNSQRLCRPTYPGYMYKRIGSPCELGSLLTDKSMGSNRPRPRPRRPRDAPVATKQPTIASRNNEEEPTVGVPTASTTVHDFPDDVLELVLLRLGSSVSLVRAASACKRWCRVAADAGFLARFRLLRVPLILGLYHNGGCRPVFLPSPTLGIPVSQQSFSLDFLPEVDGTWETVDSRDGLLLLRNRYRTPSRSRRSDPDLAVCEPKTRRCRAIILPDRLSGRKCLGVFLLRGGATGRAGGDLCTSMSNFRVMVVLLREHMLDRRRGVPEACVYQASTSERSWRDMNCAWKGNIDIPSATASFYFAGRADGSLYWAIEDTGGGALVLDEATAAVSLEALPVSIEGRCVAVTERARWAGPNPGLL